MHCKRGKLRVRTEGYIETVDQSLFTLKKIQEKVGCGSKGERTGTKGGKATHVNAKWGGVGSSGIGNHVYAWGR